VDVTSCLARVLYGVWPKFDLSTLEVICSKRCHMCYRRYERANAVQPTLSDCTWRTACILYGQQQTDADTRIHTEAGRLIALGDDSNIRLF
jgi:hypothetical protein